MSTKENNIEEMKRLEPYRPLVRKVVSRRVQSCFVEDVVQESFRRAVSGIHRLRTPEALSSWLVKVASRAVSDFHMKRNKVNEVSSGTETTELITSHEAKDHFQYSYNKLMYKQIVRLLMERLDDDDQELIKAFYFDELSHRQVGERMGISERNVRVRLHRLRVRMRQLMAQYHDSVELFGVQSQE